MKGYLFIYLFNGQCAWKHNFWVMHQFFQGCEAIYGWDSCNDRYVVRHGFIEDTKSQLPLVSVWSVDKHWIQTNSKTMVLETLKESVKVLILSKIRQRILDCFIRFVQRWTGKMQPLHFIAKFDCCLMELCSKCCLNWDMKFIYFLFNYMMPTSSLIKRNAAPCLL